MKSQQQITIIVMLPLLLVTTTAVLTVASAQTVYESEEDGFRLQIPQGWVIQDDNITTPSSQLGNSEVIAALCLENEALPAVGGRYNCEAAARTDEISIERWPDLQSRPEFGNNITSSNYTITINDLLALRIQWLQNNASVFGIKIENSTDIDEFTKLVNMTYTVQVPVNTFFPVEVDRKSSQMYVLNQDRNTGYVIYNNLNNTQTQQHSPAVQEVFNSFELLE